MFPGYLSQKGQGEGLKRVVVGRRKNKKGERREREDERELVGYPTGDMVVLRRRGRNEGWLEYVGRKKKGGEVKVRGFRVDLEGVRGSLVKCCEGLVKEAHVMMVGGKEEKGEGEEGGVLVAFCVFVEGKGEGGEEEVRRRMGKVVPEYMVPSLVVGGGELPLTKNLKVDEKALMRLWESKREGGGEKKGGEEKRRKAKRRSRGKGWVAQGVEECWKNVLGGRWRREAGEREREKLSFFEMGGDSLLLMGLSSSLSHRFGFYAPPSLLLSLSTLGKQVGWVEGKVGRGNQKKEEVEEIEEEEMEEEEVEEEEVDKEEEEEGVEKTSVSCPSSHSPLACFKEKKERKEEQNEIEGEIPLWSEPSSVSLTISLTNPSSSSPSSSSSSSYGVHGVIKYCGNLNPRQLRLAMWGVCSRHPVLRSNLQKNEEYWGEKGREGGRNGEGEVGTPFSLLVLLGGGKELGRRVEERVIFASEKESSFSSPPVLFSPSLSLSPEEEEILPSLLSLYSHSVTNPSSSLPWVLVVHEGESKEGEREGERRGGFICFVASHVVVDDVSVEIILSDLLSLYDSLEGEEIGVERETENERERERTVVLPSLLRRTFPFTPLFPHQSLFRLSSLASSFSPSPSDITWWREVKVGRRTKKDEKENNNIQQNTLILAGFTPDLSLPPSPSPSCRSFHLPIEKNRLVVRDMEKVCGLFGCSPFVCSLSLFLFWKQKVNYSRVRGKGEREGGEGGVCRVVGVPVSERKGGRERGEDVGCFVKVLPIPWPVSLPSSRPSHSSSLFSHMQEAIPFLNQALSRHSLTTHQILHLLRSPFSPTLPSPFSSSPDDSFDILFAQDEYFSLSRKQEKKERVGEGFLASPVSLPPSSPKTQAIFFFSWWGEKGGRGDGEGKCCGRVEVQVDGGGISEVMGRGLLESYHAFLIHSLSFLASGGKKEREEDHSQMKLSLLSPHQKSLLTSFNLPALLPPHLRSPSPLPPYSPQTPLPLEPFSPSSFLPSHRIGGVFLRRVLSDPESIFLKTLDANGHLGRCLTVEAVVRGVVEVARRVALRFFPSSSPLSPLLPTNCLLIVGKRCPELIIAMLCSSLLGIPYLTLDPSWPSSRVLSILSSISPLGVLVCPPDGGWEREEEGDGWNVKLFRSLRGGKEGGVFSFGAGPLLTFKIPCPFEKEIKYRQQHHEQSSQPHQQQWFSTAQTLDRGGDLYFIFTSGTTGRPKGVKVGHTSVLSLLYGASFLFPTSPPSPSPPSPSLSPPPTPCIAVLSHPSFDAIAFEVWGGVVREGMGVCVIEENVVEQPERLRRGLAEGWVKGVFMTVGLFEVLVGNHSSSSSSVPCFFSSLPVEFIITGGDVVNYHRLLPLLHAPPSHPPAIPPPPPPLISATTTNFPPPPSPSFSSSPTHLPPQLIVAYGPTECTIFTSLSSLSSLPRSFPKTPLGHPLSGRVCLVMGEGEEGEGEGGRGDGLVCPVGVWGELWVGGCGVARGYVGGGEGVKGFRWVEGDWLGEVIPEEVFGEREKEEGESNRNKYKMKFYRTGDIVRWLPDGRLEFLSRSSADRQIKLRGHRYFRFALYSLFVYL